MQRVLTVLFFSKESDEGVAVFRRGCGGPSEVGARSFAYSDFNQMRAGRRFSGFD